MCTYQLQIDTEPRGAIPSSSKHREDAPTSTNTLATLTAPSSAAQCKGVIRRLKRSQVMFSTKKLLVSTQLKLEQVVIASVVEQCRNATVIMAEQCCSTNNVVEQ